MGLHPSTAVVWLAGAPLTTRAVEHCQ